VLKEIIPGKMVEQFKAEGEADFSYAVQGGVSRRRFFGSGVPPRWL
jgi:hypothetical protein